MEKNFMFTKFWRRNCDENTSAAANKNTVGSRNNLRENLRERTREGTRALSCAIFARSFPKTPKTGFFSHQYQRDVISQNSHDCAKYLYSSVAFFGVAFVISEVLYWHPLQLYKARWAKAFASNLIPRALFLQFSCNITFWEESEFVAMGALITRATDPRFRENK